MRTVKERIASQPDFLTMDEEGLREHFMAWLPAGSGFTSGIICRLILDICSLRGIDTKGWF